MTILWFNNGNEFEKYASWLNIIARLIAEVAGNGMTVLQILENSQESNHGGALF